MPRAAFSFQQIIKKKKRKNDWQGRGERIKSQAGWDKLRKKLEPQTRLSGGLHLWKHEEPFSISVSALFLQQQSAAFCSLIHGDGGEGLRLGIRFKEESVGADQETGLLCLHQNSDGPQWTSRSVQACFDANTPAFSFEVIASALQQ